MNNNHLLIEELADLKEKLEEHIAANRGNPDLNAYLLKEISEIRDLLLANPNTP